MLVVAPTPYSETMEAQYEELPIALIKEAMSPSAVSPSKTTGTKVGDVRTEPPLLVAFGIAGCGAG
jgi:hypothetical protein